VAQRFCVLSVFADTLGNDVDRRVRFYFLDFALPVCLILCRRGFRLRGLALVVGRPNMLFLGASACSV
jgi:hypothetical protein